jgi:hypothetical protein
MSSRRILHLSEALLIFVFIGVLIGSLFYPFPFKILGYEFVPPQLRLPPEVGLVIGLLVPLLIPILSNRIERIMGPSNTAEFNKRRRKTPQS